MLKKGMQVQMISGPREEMKVMDMIYGDGNFGGYGVVEEVSPENLLAYPEFQHVSIEDATNPENQSGLVYFDTSAGRRYFVEIEYMVEKEVN